MVYGNSDMGDPKIVDFDLQIQAYCCGHNYGPENKDRPQYRGSPLYTFYALVLCVYI